MCQFTNTSGNLTLAALEVADLAGPMSFAALSFLIAALAIFRDLKQDRYSLPPRYFANLKIVAYLLSAEVLAWCLLFFQRSFSVLPDNIGKVVVTAVVTAMVLGVALVAIYLSGFVAAVIQFVANPVHSKKELPKR